MSDKNPIEPTESELTEQELELVNGGGFWSAMATAKTIQTRAGIADALIGSNKK